MAVLRKLCTSLSSVPRRSFLSDALVYSKYGEPKDVLNLRGRKIDGPNNGEVLVKMLASPVHPSDINTVQGVYPVKPTLPAVGGNEGVGKVIELGSGVSSLSIGDIVYPASNAVGTWQTHLCLKEDSWLRLDKRLPITSAAVIGVNPSTAYRMLMDFVPLEPGDVFIQNGSTSAVGIYAMQIAKIMGWKSINLFRARDTEKATEETRQYLLDHGATWALTDEEFTSATNSIKADISQHAPPPKLALNCLGGKPAIMQMRSLGHSGCLVSYGAMTRSPMPVPTSPLLFKNISLRGFWITDWVKRCQREERVKMLDQLSEWFISGQLKESSFIEIPFARWHEAIEMSSFTDKAPSLIKGKAILSMEPLE